MSSGKILIVEDDDSLRSVMQVQLAREGYETSSVSTAEEALPILEKSFQNLVITDLHLPGISGIELLKKVRLDYPETAMIVMTAFGTVQTAVETMKAGAYDYLTKPIQPYELTMLVRRTIQWFSVTLRTQVRIASELRDVGRDSCRRGNYVDTGGGDRRSRHPFGSCGCRILGKGDPARSSYRANTERSIGTGAGKDDADCPSLLHLGERAKESVYGQWRTVVRISRNEFQMAVSQRHLGIRCDHVRMIDFHAIAVHRLMHRNRGLPREQLGQDATVRRAEVLHDYICKRRICRHIPKKLGESFEAASGRTDPDDRYRRITHRFAVARIARCRFPIAC